ncbi:baseplate J/gp47 family protein [Ignatzschineria rhizosphaerae]|uniref:Baseplate J/gp47 family protein n=1 Tax=Ignatzschineria rhizosphaerae TaxID=2923279 RepID=A0ABY3X1T8_9GAMM|nr:baseplate J/gp47 family protein [Ignatzschineria rhizosphaerae]UNM95659.1 baseplate J/gp47 family protein [Ignatzschineria rhizosphaerae]
MAYKAPKLSELIARTHANIQSNLGGSKSFLKRSVLGAIAYAIAALAAGLYHFLEWIYYQCVPHLSEDELFIAHAKECGVFRKSATIAKGSVKVFSEKSVVIPKGTELQRTDGTLYIVTEDAKGINEIIVSVESVNAGVNQNVKKGEFLSFIKPILYVQNVAEVIDISGGSDIESMAQFRERYIFFCQYPPMGGNEFDYVRWMRENSGVSRAWCFPRVRGGNTVGVAWVYDDRNEILPTSIDVASVTGYLDKHKHPITNGWTGSPAGAEVIYIPLKLKPINLIIKLIPDTLLLRENVRDSLEKAINADAAPSKSLPRTHLSQAISNSAGEYDHRLISPTADEIVAGEFELLVLGKIEWR